MLFSFSHKICLGFLLVSHLPTLLISQEILYYGDIVLNEVLYRPEKDEAEFIEIHNNLSHSVALEDLLFAIADDTIALGSGTLPAQSFLVFTANKSAIINKYPQANSEFVHEIKLSRLTDSGKLIAIFYLDQDDLTLLDSFFYKPSYHSELLTDDRGVSLERIDPSFPSNRNNWTSCRNLEKYATPTQINSVQSKIRPPSEKLNFTYSEVISPNGDGHQDDFFILPELDKNNYLVSATVVNLAGRKEIEITKRQEITLLESQDWSVLESLDSGHYFLLLEVYNNSGFRELFQLPFAVIR